MINFTVICSLIFKVQIQTCTDHITVIHLTVSSSQLLICIHSKGCVMYGPEEVYSAEMSEWVCEVELRSLKLTPTLLQICKVIEVVERSQ